MEKINFKQYFNCDYPGYKTFEQEVLIPIFGDYYQPEDIAENYIIDEEEEEKAKKANIKDIQRMATISPTDGNASFNAIEVFDITVSDKSKLSRSRVAIQQFIRSKNFGHSHVLMLFHYETPNGRSWRFSYFYKDNTLKETTNARRYTYLFGEKEKVRTANQRFNKLLEVLHKKNHVTTDEDIENAFSVEKLSDEFFEKYLAFYVSFVKFITGKKESKESIKKECFQQTLKKIASLGKSDTEDQYHKYFMPKYKEDEEECDKAVRNYVKKMMGRLVFLHFLQRKEWMCGDRDFMRHLFENSEHQDDFLDRVLEPLFFAVLNTQPSKRKLVCQKHNDYPYNKDQRVDWDEELIEQWKDIPYLNGGLFEQEKIDECRTKFPKEYFEALFNFFDEYNFTIDENDPHDAIVGVDPEMLSKIFENLLEDNKDKGAFYTPKTIVHYMCTESLIAYLQEKCKDTDIKDTDLRKFVLEPHAYMVDTLADEQRASLSEALKNVHVCDPAIGSGAFPMGMLNAIYACRHELEPLTPAFDIKLHIIQNNIFGVDIEQGAVDIARLRFWLALVVEEQEPHALPNLDYRIVRGNSLLTTFMNEYVNLDGYSGRVKTTKLKKELANKQKEYYSLNGEEKLKKEIEIKQLILDILEAQLNIDRKAAKQKEVKDYGSIYNNTEVSAKAIKESKEAKAISAQKQKLITEINKKRNVLTSVNRDLFERARIDIEFFDWKVIFSNVFDNNNGFDIVIGNPPYFVYEGIHKDEIQSIKNDKQNFQIALGGKLNAYKLFLAKAINSLTYKNGNGLISYIFQNSFLADKQATELRKYTINNSQILTIDSFPERDNKKKRVFESAKMSVCIVLLKQAQPTNSFIVNIWEDKDKKKGITTSFNKDEIVAIDSENESIPRLNQQNVPLIVKMNNIPNRIKVHCWQGELNMTTHKKYLSQDLHKPMVLKGASIQRYYWTQDMSQGIIEYVDADKYKQDFPKAEKALHHNNDRIVMQGMTGANDKIRLVSTLIPKGFYLAHSCNYIIPMEGVELKYLLGILNSKIANWYFRCFSTNSNVNSYEVESIPIPSADEDKQHYISNIVSEILSAKASFPTADTSALEQEIDRLIYKLYGLTYDEVKIVDPETPLTEEDYNKE